MRPLRLLPVFSAPVAAALLVVLVGAAGCTEQGPSPEWLSAKAEYDAAMAEPGNIGYLGPHWDVVVSRLKAVPASNAHDHRLSQALLDEIEGTRRRVGRDLSQGQAQADKLLDLPSLPPLATEQPAPPAAPAVVPPSCRKTCQTAFWGCLKSAGCTIDEKKDGPHADCSGDAVEPAKACRETQLACDKVCP